MTLILNNTEVEKLFDMQRCLVLLEGGYRDLGLGKGVVRPRVHSYMKTSVPGRRYMFKSMEGGLEDLGIMALRISSEHNQTVKKYGSVRKEELPATSYQKFLGLILLFSTETTELLAIMPDGYIQSQRVGATWALGAKYLARHNCETIGIFGSGQQAPAFLQAHCLVRPGVKLTKVYSPSKEHRTKFATQMSERLKVEVIPVNQPRDVMRGSDIVLSATNAREPVVLGNWVEPGMHIGCISPGQADDDFFAKVDIWVAFHRLTSLVVRSHDVPFPEKGPITQRFQDLEPDEILTLMDLLCDRVAGRSDERQITYFGGINLPGETEGFGSSGIGVQFAVIGHDIYKRALESGFGREIPGEWFLEDWHP